MAFSLRIVAAAAVVAATLAAPPHAGAAVCTAHELATGRTQGHRQPAGSPDADWVVTSTPLLGAPAPAVVTEPFFVWSTNAYVDWITVPGGSAAGPYPNLTASWPPGMFTFQFRFTVPPGFQVPYLVFHYMADNGVEFSLNGTPIGGYPGTGPDDWSPFRDLRVISLSPPPWITGVNVLEARVTSYGGPIGLLVDGWATLCA